MLPLSGSIIRAFKVFSDLFGRNPQMTGKAIHCRPRSIQRLAQRSAALHCRPMRHGILITRLALFHAHAVKFLLRHIARPPMMQAQGHVQQCLYFNGLRLVHRQPYGRADLTPLQALEIPRFQYVAHVIKATSTHDAPTLLDLFQARRSLLLQLIQFALYAIPPNGLPFYGRRLTG